MAEADLLYSDITRKIIGVAMEIHSTLGAGFLESVYEEAMAVEFEFHGIKYERKKRLMCFIKAGN